MVTYHNVIFLLYGLASYGNEWCGVICHSVMEYCLIWLSMVMCGNLFVVLYHMVMCGYIWLLVVTYGNFYYCTVTYGI